MAKVVKEKVEYSYVYSTKGTQYMINICANGAATDGIVVSLFDSNRKSKGSQQQNWQSSSVCHCVSL